MLKITQTKRHSPCLVSGKLIDKIKSKMQFAMASKFSWSMFSHIGAEYGEMLVIESECGKTQTRKNSEYGYVLRSGYFDI